MSKYREMPLSECPTIQLDAVKGKFKHLFNSEGRGSLCLHCPNEIKYRLNSFFYCEKGAATEKNVATKTINQS